VGHCAAALSIAYQYAETMLIFPITHTTLLGERADQMAASGKTNAFGVVPKIQQMHSLRLVPPAEIMERSISLVCQQLARHH